jgi:hypothetical protein
MSTETYRIDFDEIKRGIPMEQVVAFLAIPGLKARGARQWKGPCPFCKGLDCFVVSNDGGREKTGAFNCFRCPAGGDQIELVSLSRGHARRDRQGTLAAAKELHEKFLRAKGGAANGDSSSNASPQPSRERRAGFDPEAYAKGLDPAHEALAGLGVDPETFRQWKAGYVSAGVLRGRLALPVAGKDGAVVGYFGRSTKGESPTLIFPNGLNPHDHIFGADRVTSEPLYLLRDPIDVLKAFESGYGNAVCFLTEDIAPIQLEALAALMDERKCESLSFF